MFAVPHINFSEPQGALRGWGGRAGWLLLAAGAAGIAGVIGAQLYFAQRIERAEAHVEQLRRGADASIQMRKPIPPKLAAEIASANLAIERLSVPWTALFQALEGARNERVVILGMQPSVQEGEIRLLGEADDFTAITGLLDALGKQSGVRRARLASHEIRAQGKIQFEVVAEWKPSR